jgi:hypothetical protein
MPGRSSLQTRNLNQIAVYWGSPYDDGWGGKTFASAIEIMVRWEEKTMEIIDSMGRQTIARAIVFANQDLDIGGYLYLGELADLSSDPDPKDTVTAYEIRQFQKVSDLSGSRFIRKAFL